MDSYATDLNRAYAAKFGRGLPVAKKRLIFSIRDGSKAIGEAEISRDQNGKCFLESFTIDEGDLQRIFDDPSSEGRLIIKERK